MTATLHRLPVLDADDLPQRPRTRGECADVPRPCPFVSCRHNLYLDVSNAGTIFPTWPAKEPHEVDPNASCSLDVADEGGLALIDIGAMLGVTSERIRQIEAVGLKAMRLRRGNTLAGFRDHDDPPKGGSHGHMEQSRRVRPPPATSSEPEDRDAPLPPEAIGVSFFAEGERADELVSDDVWRMYVRASRDRGIEAFENASERHSRQRTARSGWQVERDLRFGRKASGGEET